MEMSERPQPNAPDSIPDYISDGLPKQDDDTLRDVIAYAHELIDHRALAEPEIPDDAEIVEESADNGGSIVKEMVVCGKPNCKCADGEKHGPYKYRYYSVKDTTKKEYIGKAD